MQSIVRTELTQEEVTEILSSLPDANKTNLPPGIYFPAFDKNVLPVLGFVREKVSGDRFVWKFIGSVRS
jgi:hypothetical protein